MWKEKTKMISVLVGAFGTGVPKRGEWLQQIPESTSEFSAQKSAVRETVKILHRTIKLQAFGRGSKIE